MKAYQIIITFLFLTSVCNVLFAQEVYERRCTIIKKPFTTQEGEVTDKLEYYLQCNNGEAFIKLCEGEVSEDQLLPLIGQKASVRIMVIEGDWDNCDTIIPEQSRVGTYVVLLSAEKYEGETDDNLTDKKPPVTKKGKTKIDFIHAKETEDLVEPIMCMIRHISSIDSIEFIDYFMPLSEYRKMSSDTTVNSLIRQGMGAITEEQYKYRYLLVYQRLTRSMEENGFNPKKAKKRNFTVSTMNDGGIYGMEGILEMECKGKKFSLKVLAIQRNDVWNLVEVDRVMVVD